MKENLNSSISLGFMTFVVFLILKLTDKINWSWIWVTSPLWIPLGLGVALFLIGVIITLIVNLMD